MTVLPTALILHLVAGTGPAADPFNDGGIVSFQPGAHHLTATACGPETVLCPRGSPARQLAAGTGSTGLLLFSTAAGLAAGWLVPQLHFRAYGRPDPLVSTFGIALGMGTGVLVSQLLVPAGAALGNDPLHAASIREVRAAAWRTARWPALASGVGVALLTVGAIQERGSFGSGQAWMGAGIATVAGSALVYAGVELVSVLRAGQRVRRARP